jgi:GDP/UDP-N,N'-diacetylbacillosamine 2-epimerase (hydrolysing)
MKVFLITSTRADFGLLKNLIINLKKDKFFRSKIFATGTHFSKKYGFSYKEIEKENVLIYKKILLSNITKSSKYLIKDINYLIKKFSLAVSKERPDLIIVLGDRYEIFSIVLTAYINRIPIAHISGGEKTVGSLDDGFRHCITKMSNLHFVSNDVYKKRLKQLGENPKTIFNVGPLGIETTYNTEFLSKNHLQKKLKIDFKKKILLVCLQPEITKELTLKLVNETLSALTKHQNKTIIFTMPGADLHNEIIIKRINNFSKKKSNCYSFKTLGSLNYLSLLKIAHVIIGNSSSGVIEMPRFRKYTINIGDRQKGRMSYKSIINIPPIRRLIDQKINYIFSSKTKLKYLKNPYKKTLSSKKILSILKKVNLKNIINKEFYDIKF